MDSLPNFPNFTRLDLKHKNLLRKITQEFPPYSDYNFVSLFTWNHDDKILVSNLNHNLVIRFTDYMNGEEFLSFLGTNKILQTIDTLLDYCHHSNLNKELRLIGQAVVDALPKEMAGKYVIKEDENSHDYILSTEIASDVAVAYPQKRTKLNHFSREHGHTSESRVLNLDSGSTIQEIEDLLSSWQQVRNKTDSDVRREFAAVRRALEHANDLDMQGYGTYVKNKLVAFTLFEVVHNETAMLHFGKNDTRYIGSNEHLQNQLANHLLKLGIKLMNNEQDLGLEGLRKSKMASKPVMFLKKYTISLAPKD